MVEEGSLRDWPGANVLLIAALAVAIVIFIVTLVRRGRKKGRTILLLGAPDSGKTTLFFQLLDRDTHNGTVASMQANEADAKPEADLGEARLVDIPGHPRVRGEWESYLDETRGIVFVVDGINFLPIKTAIAEQLFDVLAHPTISSRKLPILLAINKTDAGPRAHSPDFIRKRLERELDALRSSRVDLAAASGGTGSASLSGSPGEAFSFAGLATHRGVGVRIASIAAVQAEGVAGVRAFVSDVLSGSKAHR